MKPTKNRRRALFGLAAAVALAAIPSCKSSEKQREDQPEVRIDVQRHRVQLFGDEHALGGEQPLVTIVMFSDYACGPCKTAWQVMENLVEDYGEDVSVVWRAYSVPGFQHGERAAEAALAAGAQGKFWAMHQRLFEHQGSGFDRPMLRAHAEAIGLDVQRFLDDVDTGAHAGTRIRHRREATRLGVRGAPIAFFNGLPVVGARDEDTWHAFLDEEIREVRELMKHGTPRAQVHGAIMAKAADKPIPAPTRAKKLREQMQAKNAEAERDATELTTPDPSKRYRIVPGDAPTLGPADAPVVVVEFMDFRCPFCRRAWNREISELVETFDGQVQLAIKHMPLEIHPTADAVAKASIAAQRQGKFWAFHDRMIDFEGAIGRSVLLDVARELGFDVKQFERDFDDPAVAEQLQQDRRLAERVGVTATPAFFINGRYVRGFQPGQVTGVIREELELVQQRRKRGIPRDEIFENVMAEAIPESKFPNP